MTIDGVRHLTHLDTRGIQRFPRDPELAALVDSGLLHPRVLHRAYLHGLLPAKIYRWVLQNTGTPLDKFAEIFPWAEIQNPLE